MNGPRYRQEKKIFKTYNEKIQLDSIQTFCDFLTSYITAYEDENGLMRSSFITENPLDDIEHLKTFNDEYYRLINEKFTHYVKNYLFYMKKPKLIGKVISAYGFALEYGLFNIPIDKYKAVKHYELSATMCSPFGTFRLAQCYEKGVGCEKSKYTALTFYRCAAKLGSVQGLHTYGTILLQNDIDVDFRIESAVVYLHIGVNISSRIYPFVCYDYGRYLEYQLTTDDILADVKYCFKIYYKGAQNECPNCQFKIAQCYETGELETQIDIQKAFSYYKSSAFNGNIDAQLKIAQTLVEQKELTASNFYLAFKYAIKAAVKGHCVAMKYIIVFYEKGLGIPKDTNAAKWWNKILMIHLKQQKFSIDVLTNAKIENMCLNPIETIEEVIEDLEPVSDYVKVQ